MATAQGPWRAAVVAPHSGAAEVGADVLREGGNAYEAMVAAAAAIAVLYPHMNGLGGDAFWLIHEPGSPSWGINGCGRAAQAATPGWYAERGYQAIPQVGPAAANTAPGAVASWIEALNHAHRELDGRMPLERLLAPAIDIARHGRPVASALATALQEHGDALCSQPGFASLFAADGRVKSAGDTLRQPALADVLEELSREGLATFYRGDVGDTLARELGEVASPVGREDLAACAAMRVAPLHLDAPYGRTENLPPPTQGLASLLILGLYERYRERAPHATESADYIHALVEATKTAFQVRDRVVTDPDHVPEPAESWLRRDSVDALAEGFDAGRAAPWPPTGGNGDTVWLGAIDEQGRQVSFIQSLFHGFGSGVVLPETGVLWQNRGCSFRLESDSIHQLAPGKQPFHTLNPAMAGLEDGRRVVYGTMGGHGQPQTQAAVLTRLVHGDLDAATAIRRPRWLLGRAWGEGRESLKVENEVPEDVLAELNRRGHEVEAVPAVNSLMGHAGALVRHPDGGIDAASDPRSDGGVDGVP